MPPTIPILPSSSACTHLPKAHSLRITSHAGTQTFSLWAFRISPPPPPPPPPSSSSLSPATSSPPSSSPSTLALPNPRILSYLSTTHTRAHLQATSLTRPGEVLLDNTRKPLLVLREDTSVLKRHDLMFPACDGSRYEQLGKKGHPSCVGNLKEAMGKAGLVGILSGGAVGEEEQEAVVVVEAVPDPVNLFMNVKVVVGGMGTIVGEQEGRERIEIGATDGVVGAEVVFQALEECVVVVCACAMDLVPGNGGVGGLSGGEMEVL